jgi:hypothetical protein
MNHGDPRDPRTEIANFPNSGKWYPIFAWEVAYESDPCYDCARLHYFADDPRRSAKELLEQANSSSRNHLSTRPAIAFV